MIPQTSLKDPPPISSHHNHNRNHNEKITTEITMRKNSHCRHITRPTWRRSRGLGCTATRLTLKCLSKNIRLVMPCRHDICQNFYPTGVFGAKILHKNAEIGKMANSRQNSMNLHSVCKSLHRLCKVYTILCKLN